MRLRDVVDQFHHVDGLAHTGAAEQTHLAALGERADQVDHLDTGFEQFGRGRQIVEGWSLLVDFARFGLVDRARFIDRAAQHVHDTAERRLADRHADARARVAYRQTAAQTFRRTQTDGPDHAVAQLLLDFERQFGAVHNERVINLRHMFARKFHVDHRADALDDFAFDYRSTHRFSFIPFGYLIRCPRPCALLKRYACAITRPRRRPRQSRTVPS